VKRVAEGAKAKPMAKRASRASGARKAASIFCRRGCGWRAGRARPLDQSPMFRSID
jgi:hypothetical protein